MQYNKFTNYTFHNFNFHDTYQHISNNSMGGSYHFIN